MSQKLNLKNDIMFKAFFGKKGNERYLKEFLESLLKIHIEKIDIRSEVSLLKLDEKEKGKRWKTRFRSKIKWWINSKYRDAVKKLRKHGKKNNVLCIKDIIKRSRTRRKI